MKLYKFAAGGLAGVFFHLNRLLHGWQLAETCGFRLAPDWTGICYADESTSDLFDQFFRRADHTAKEKCRAPALEPRLRRMLHDRRITIAAPRGPQIPEPWRSRFGCATCLYPPTNRNRGGELIALHLRPHASLLDRVDRFWSTRLEGAHVVGLHLRGPGRLHGGVPYFHAKLGLDAGPPYGRYFEFVERQLQSDSVVLLCTDAKQVQQRVRERYGRRVVCTTDNVTWDGEDHFRKGGDVSGTRLALEALQDAWLLARTSALVRGNSNLGNFVACLNPELHEQDIYAECYTAI